MAERIVGREAEMRRIEAFLDPGETVAPILLLEGHPGMGKSTLWADAVQRAAAIGWRVLSVRPTDAEATFAYAGLGDLLESVPDDALGALPLPQRQALRVALLRAEPEGPDPDARAVAVACLNTLRAIAASEPLVVAIDDVQWLDPPSAQALAFAIRRLEGAAIRFVIARRVADRRHAASVLDRVLAGLPMELIEVGPLDAEAERRLLAARLGHTVPNGTLRRVRETSGGNPLFAIALARALDRGAPIENSPDDVAIPSSILDVVAGPVRDLPDETQRTLAVVAALTNPTLDLVSAAIQAPAEASLRPAIEAHVVHEGDRIRFAHPLLAVAARASRSAAERRTIHAALARLVSDPEERARHLALASAGPDETVAAALEEAALRARARGAADAAAELAGMAHRLTPPERRDDAARRLAAEAWQRLLVGDYPRVREIAQTLATADVARELRWRGRALLAVVTCWVYDLRAGVELYRQAIADIGDDDRERLLWEGGMTGALDLLGDDYREALAHGYAELELAERFDDPSRAVTALRGIARNEQRLTGRMPADLIERAMEREGIVRQQREVAGWPSFCLADMLTWTDDLDAALARWDWLYAEASARGELHSLVDILYRAILCEVAAGRLSRAVAHAKEGSELARDVGAAVFEATLVAERALVHALLGDADATRSDAAAAVRLSAGGNPQADRIASWALGELELVLGNHTAACAHLVPLVASRRAAGVAEPGEMRFVPDAVEALARAGRLDDAEAMLAWYQGLADHAGRVGALAANERCRAVLLAARGELDAAVDHATRAVDLHRGLTDPLGLARSLLVLGMSERRRLQKRAAREALAEAATGFEALGAALWAESARAELARIGGRIASPDALTATEERVATLVAEGRTNREVAAILVVSERTVEGHLSRIYAKVGVRSRSELARHVVGGDVDLR